MEHRERARIDTAEASLVVERTDRGELIWRHFGSRTGGLLPGGAGAWLAQATFFLDEPSGVPLLPVSDDGLFGPPTIGLRSDGGDLVRFAPDTSTLQSGEGWIRASFADSSSGAVVIVSLEGLQGGALRIETVIENAGGRPLLVDRLSSAAFPVPAETESILSWRGHHAAEGAECIEPLPEHGWYRETRLGMTGHGGPPGFYLCPAGRPFDEGLTVAAQLAWSGDSRLIIERLAGGDHLAVLEAVLLPGEIVLVPGARYSAPPVFVAISAAGRNRAMAQQHAAIRDLITSPGAGMSPRPVHLNSWEACYFSQNEPEMMALAQSAASLGVERFVVDDGWFAGRSDDTRALGDWTPDPAKYPQGLGPLASLVQSLGMQLGLWVEPEMISPASELYRAHPDWALATPNRQARLGRNQLVLDMRQREVRDHLFAALDSLLTEVPIGYLKWDHNRAHAPSGGALQVAGTYELMARLRAAHPALEIESCAAGGGRSDAGIAQFVHRFWASDNLDAVARVDIQRSFTAFLPPETMGSHVGDSPAHATGRQKSIAFRAAVASMGHFGIELDPRRLTEDDRVALSHWISFYKEWREVIHGGELRLGEGSDGILWQAHGDGSQWLLFVIRSRPANDKRPRPLRLPFLRGAHWKARLLRLAGASRWLGSRPWVVEKATPALDGDWLATAGLPLPPTSGEAVAVFHFEPG